MNVIDRMKIFIKVANVQSFTKAADEMNIPRSTVSTAIQELENALTIRLLQRTTRQVSLTYEGQKYFERCQEIINDVEEAQNMFLHRPEQVKGKVRIDMAASLASGSIIPKLSEILAKHPQLEIEISCTDQTIDLVRNGIDCAIRTGPISQAGTIEKMLGEVRLVNCASPSYLKKFGTPKSIKDLSHHQLVFYSQVLGGRKWGFEYFDGKEYREVKMNGVITVNNTDAFRSACVSGLGIAQIPYHGVKNLIDSGKLVEILPDLKAEPLKIRIVYSERRLMADRVRTIIKWLEPTIQKLLV